jgi:alkanesulfonate monooxygenase SsuD/methylene tetrahydromethanopterin reductase-like flavin-dependent oxidoreductase (luciferase family)
VRTHVVRRYGVEFERPGPRLRDYVSAVKACFAAFRGAPLDHHGEFYDLDFLTPQWSPGPIEQPDPKVDVAAVNPWMLRMAGEVADGVHVHPIGEPGYLERHVVPGIAAGAARAGRDPDDIAVIVPVTTVVGDTTPRSPGAGTWHERRCRSTARRPTMRSSGTKPGSRARPSASGPAEGR